MSGDCVYASDFIIVWDDRGNKTITSRHIERAAQLIRELDACEDGKFSRVGSDLAECLGLDKRQWLALAEAADAREQEVT